MKAQRLAATLTLMRAFLPWPDFVAKHANQIHNDAPLQITFEKKCSGSGRVFTAAIAAEEAKRRHGLSNRKNPLAPDEAMIFIFERPEILSFWMKETLIPLQLIYVEATGKVLETREMPVEKDPNHPKNYYTATMPASVAIEVAPRTLKSTAGLQLCVNAP